MRLCASSAATCHCLLPQPLTAASLLSVLHVLGVSCTEGHVPCAPLCLTFSHAVIFQGLCLLMSQRFIPHCGPVMLPCVNSPCFPDAFHALTASPLVFGIFWLFGSHTGGSTESALAGWWSFVFKPCSSAEFPHGGFSLLLQKQDFSFGLFIFWTVKYWGTRLNLSLCLWNSAT